MCAERSKHRASAVHRGADKLLVPRDRDRTEIEIALRIPCSWRYRDIAIGDLAWPRLNLMFVMIWHVQARQRRTAMSALASANSHR
eukprot:4774738-Alexandrium_andersonii.AAC.1